MIGILGYYSDGIQIILATSGNFLPVVGARLGACAGTIFPLAVLRVPVVFGTRYFSISGETAALTLVSFGGLGLLMHTDLAHLWINIVLERWYETRLLLTTNSH